MKSIVLATMLSTVSLIAGCATTSGDYCDIARAVRPHASDVLSEQTKRDMLAELKKLEKLCGVRP